MFKLSNGWLFDRVGNRDHANRHNKENFKNDCIGVYVPPTNRDRNDNGIGSSIMENMLVKALQRVESIEFLKCDLSNMSQVDSHSISLK